MKQKKSYPNLVKNFQQSSDNQDLETILSENLSRGTPGVSPLVSPNAPKDKTK